MKKNIFYSLSLIAAAFLLNLQANAQVAIRETGTGGPDASAMLEIVSADKGILIPRVADATAISSPATGLLVYQTGAPAGFYYNDGASWVQLNNVWGVSGSDIYYSSGSVAIGGNTPDGSAILDLTNSSDKGILIPTIADATSISAPATGLLVYQTGGTAGFYYYDGSWTRLASGAGSVASVTASAPLSSSGGANPDISITQSNGSTNGYLSSTDWTTFNNKAGGSGASTRLAYWSGANTLTSSSSLTTNGTNSITLGNATISASSVTPAKTFTLPDRSITFDNITTSTSTNISGLLLGNGTSVVAAVGGTDYQIPTWTVSTNDINFYSGSGLGSGNVSIGTATSSNKLLVKNDNTSSAYVAYFDNSGNSNTSYGIQIKAGLDSWLSGNNPIFINCVRPNGNQVGRAYQSNTNTLTWATSSDIRLKENLVNTLYTITTLMKIKVRDFNWREDAKKQLCTGFVAQELYEVYPSAVSLPDKPEGTWMVAKEELIPLMVKSIQDQQNEITTLKDQVKNQQVIIDELLKRVSALEKNR